MDKSGQSWLLAGISPVMLSGWVWMWALPVLSRVGYYCLNQGLYKVQGKFQRFFSESKHWVSLWQALKRGILDSFSLLLSPKDTEGQDPTSPYIWVGCLYQLLFRSKLLPFFCWFFFFPLQMLVFLYNSRCVIWGIMGYAAASSFLLCLLRIWSGVVTLFSQAVAIIAFPGKILKFLQGRMKTTFCCRGPLVECDCGSCAPWVLALAGVCK